MPIYLNDTIAQYFDRERFFKDTKELIYILEQIDEKYNEISSLFVRVVNDPFIAAFGVKSDFQSIFNEIDAQITKYQRSFDTKKTQVLEIINEITGNGEKKDGINHL